MFALSSLVIAMSLPPPVMTLTGDSLQIKTARRTAIRNDVDWLTHWAEHTGQSWSLHDSRTGAEAHIALKAPMIDFSRYVAVLVYAGPKKGIAGIGVERIEDEGKQIVLVIQAIPARSQGKEMHPFGIFVIPKTEKSIVVREVVGVGSANLLDGD